MLDSEVLDPEGHVQEAVEKVILPQNFSDQFMAGHVCSEQRYY